MKRRLVLIVIVPLFMLALALLFGSVLMLRLFSVTVLLLLLSYSWTLFGIRGLAVKVEISSEHYQVGEWFKEEITVFSGSKLPKLLIKMQEITNLPGHHNGAAFNLSPMSSYCWQTEVHCQRRGQYNFGILTATVTDPFGFFSLSRDLGESQNIIVYPAILELPFFQPLSHNEPGTGPSRWLTSEIGPNAVRVREYASGDTLNRIHWHSTAHTGKLMVKEFDADRSNNASKKIWIVLDMHQASQAGFGNEGTEEYGVTIAASLVKKYIDSGKQVGLMASGDRPYLFLPQMENQHLRKMLEALALMKATGEVPVQQLLSREIERFGRDSVIIVITASASERMLMPLRQAKGRGTPSIVILLDSVSFGGKASMRKTASNLISNGFKVYLVRRGEELHRALGNQALIAPTDIYLDTHSNKQGIGNIHLTESKGNKNNVTSKS